MTATLTTCFSSSRRSMEASDGFQGQTVAGYNFLLLTLWSLPAELPTVIHNDDLDWEALRQEIAQKRYHNIVISPGPGTPARPGDIGGTWGQSGGRVTSARHGWELPRLCVLPFSRWSWPAQYSAGFLKVVCSHRVTRCGHKTPLRTVGSVGRRRASFTSVLPGQCMNLEQ